MLAQDKDKEPKRWECKDCGFISDRTKRVKYTWATFAICFKCKGSLREYPLWLEWHDRQTQRLMPWALKFIESKKVGET